MEKIINMFKSTVVSEVQITCTWKIMKAPRPVKNGQYYISRDAVYNNRPGEKDVDGDTFAEYLYPDGHISTCCWVSDEYHGWYKSQKEAENVIDKLYPGTFREFIYPEFSSRKT